MSPRARDGLFSAALALAAALLFSLEPMFARMLLPRLGGAPAVWSACMLFFQAALLAGYALAARLSFAPWPAPAAGYAALLAAGAAALPPAVTGGLSASRPELQAFALLGRGLGLPFLALAAASPLLQSWYARGPGRARDPYFLYQASAAGSLLGLLFYPLAIEPRWGLSEQSRLWEAGYAAFAALAVACALAAGPSRGEPPAPAPARGPVRERIGWLALAAAPSLLSLAVTSYLSGFIAPVPLLWIAPLAIYLASFTIAFARRPPLGIEAAGRAAALLLPPAALMWAADVVQPLALVLPLHLAALGAVALACHRRLAESRPEPERLGAFYLWLAAGGALGGLVSVASPRLFTGFVEYPLALVAAAWLLPGAPARGPRDWAAPLLLGAAAAAVPALVGRLGVPLGGLSLKPLLALPAIACFLFKERPARFALALAAFCAAAAPYDRENGMVLARARSFFGLHRVVVDRRGGFHWLINGGVVHGAQSVAPQSRRRPQAYYHPRGPFGQAFSALARGAGPVAVVGLGTGSLSCYQRPRQRWTFYEIDPAVERLARDERLFTFLRECPAEVVLGDARLTLPSREPGRLSWLVIDAFGGDAIPMHLLTAEAFRLYLEKLAPDGVLALHLSSRYLDLEPPVAATAVRLGLAALYEDDQRLEGGPGKTGSRWMVLARRSARLAPLTRDPRWSAPRPAARPWTDDRADLLSAIRWAPD